MKFLVFRSVFKNNSLHTLSLFTLYDKFLDTVDDRQIEMFKHNIRKLMIG